MLEVNGGTVSLSERLRHHARELVGILADCEGNEPVEAALLESAAILKDAANQLEVPDADLEP